MLTHSDLSLAASAGALGARTVRSARGRQRRRTCSLGLRVLRRRRKRRLCSSTTSAGSGRSRSSHQGRSSARSRCCAYALSLRGFDLEDLELRRPAGGGDLDDVALLVAHDRLADGRLVRELVLGRVRLGGADNVVLERLLGGYIADAHLR